MKRILITGGCGFIGSSLAMELVSQGYAVTVLDNLSRRGSEILLNKVVSCGIKFVHGDVRNPEDLAKLKEEYVLMIESSAEASVLTGTEGQDARYLLNVNLQGSINCFEFARERHLPVIFLSSSRVYPYSRLNACRFKEANTRFDFVEGCEGVTPNGVRVDMSLSGARSLYGTTKLCSELILEEYSAQYGLSVIINRCGVIAGPGQLGKVDQGVFTFWLANHYFKNPLRYIGFGGKGKQVRDLLHVKDLAELVVKQVQYLTGAEPGHSNEIFNVGGSLYSNLSLLEATEICAELTGNRIKIESSSENRPADMIWYITDNGRTEQVFGWKPRKSAVDILQDTLRWLQENEADFKKIFL